MSNSSIETILSIVALLSIGFIIGMWYGVRKVLAETMIDTKAAKEALRAANRVVGAIKWARKSCAHWKGKCTALDGGLGCVMCAPCAGVPAEDIYSEHYPEPKNDD